MIETFCSCGGTAHAAEAAADAGAACRACGSTVLLATAEPLADGMGAGDFDARLVVQGGPATGGGTIALGGVADLSIGKGEHRHVRLPGSMVSRAHAKLVRVDFGPSRWRVVDTASTNGLFVNGERVADADLADGDVVGIGEYELAYRTGRPAAAARSLAAARGTAGAVCPGCRTAYPLGTTVCTDCGVYVRTGKPLVVSRGLDDDGIEVRARSWIGVISWVVPFGLFPIASEAYGTKRPAAIWWITGITVAASLLFFAAAVAGGPAATDPWMLWCGTDGVAARGHHLHPTPHGEFHAYQLITNALVHAGIMHLAGNLVFLLVFGIRVNELLGNLRMAIAYPVLAVASGLVYMASAVGQPVHAALGASGAIMGLAGMYVVFFPVQKVVMTVWLRLGILTGFRLWMTIFRMRGVWLLGLWVGLNDVLPTALAAASGTASHDGTAHWAHLGGFMAGAALAVGLLVTRQVNAHGGDLLSVTLGAKAWPLLGKPTERAVA